MRLDLNPAHVPHEFREAGMKTPAKAADNVSDIIALCLLSCRDREADIGGLESIEPTHVI
jgi:hypothetical protein